MLEEGTIVEFSVFKANGTEFGEIRGSGDRVAYFSIEAATEEQLREKHARANALIRAFDEQGNDIIRHDLIARYHT